MNSVGADSVVQIPDSSLAREISEFVRASEGELLFNHSVRVYLWGAMIGEQRRMCFDKELLFAAAMFHDMGLTSKHAGSSKRFEVDGANEAAAFLRARGLSDSDIELVWNAVAFHTTPGIPEFMKPEIALIQVGAGFDVVGRGYDELSDVQRDTVDAAYPRGPGFAPKMIDAFYQGLRHRPHTTFGTFNDDFLAYKDPTFERVDVCSLMLASRWNERCGAG